MNFNLIKAVPFFGLLCLAGSSHGALVNFTQGDLLVGFRATGGTGADKNYVVNLGSAAAIRDGSVNGTLNLGDLDTDLKAIYGNDWSTRTDLYWGVAGSPSNTTTVNGDPRRTLYVSVANGGTSDGPLVVDALRASTSTLMVGFAQGATGFSTYQATANNANAAIQGVTDPASWSRNLNGGSLAGAIDFGAIDELEGHVTDSLSLYRITSGSSTFEGSFSLGANGVITAVPEPTAALLAGLGVFTVVLRRRRNA